MGLSGMKIMPKNMTKLKPPTMKARICQSTNAPMMYVMRMPMASSVAVNELSVPRIREDEHSLTYIIVNRLPDDYVALLALVQLEIEGNCACW